MDYNNKRFKLISTSENSEVSEDFIFVYKQIGNILTSKYEGGTIITGHLIGLVDIDGNIEMRYHQVNKQGILMTGICFSKPRMMKNGKIELYEKWQWTSGNFSNGTSILQEI